jgi:hypothetical protein
MPVERLVKFFPNMSGLFPAKRYISQIAGIVFSYLLTEAARRDQLSDKAFSLSNIYKIFIVLASTSLPIMALFESPGLFDLIVMFFDFAPFMSIYGF